MATANTSAAQTNTGGNKHKVSARAKITALRVLAAVVLLGVVGWFYFIKTPPVGCGGNEGRAFWQHVRCGEPAAYSTIGTFIGAFFAAVIGITAIRINANTVRGQRIHEQIRMVLEVDRELIANPRLWEIFGRTTESTTEQEAAKSNQLSEALNALAQTLRNLKEPTALQPVWTALADPVDAIAVATKAPPRPVGERDKGQEKLELELKKEALVVSYFNMFDFVHGFYTGKTSWFSPRSLRDEEDWQAWQNYIAYFFAQTNLPGLVWDKYQDKGIYSTSFVNFMSPYAALRKT